MSGIDHARRRKGAVMIHGDPGLDLCLARLDPFQPLAQRVLCGHASVGDGRHRRTQIANTKARKNHFQCIPFRITFEFHFQNVILKM